MLRRNVLSNTFLAITVLGVWSIYNMHAHITSFFDFISTNEKKTDGRLRGVDNEWAEYASMAAMSTETILTAGANATEERAAEVAKAKAKFREYKALVAAEKRAEKAKAATEAKLTAEVYLEVKVKEIKSAAEAKVIAEDEAATEAKTEEANAAADAKETVRAKVAVETKAETATETEAEVATEGAADATADPVIADARKETDGAAHEIGDLSCINYGGPLQRSDVLDIIYWNDIVSDSNFTSPLHDNNKYLTFEPDPSGWNNCRMGYETIVVMAHAMGRTLVLPPEGKFPMLKNDKRPEKKSFFSFADFYHMESLDREHAGLDVISMEEFLTRQYKETEEVIKPPGGGKRNWDRDQLNLLWQYLRTVAFVKKWDPVSCLAAIPSGNGDTAVADLLQIGEELSNLKPKNYDGNPNEVSASPIERLQEMRGNRKNLCIYDQEMQKQRLVHFMTNYKQGHRLLIHFYAFMFFYDWKHDLWSKRFVRDHLRYLDEIMCAAGRIVSLLREKARAIDEENINGDFDTLHIRRSDFQQQYPSTQLEAMELFKLSKEELTPGSVVFIATDHMDKAFFKPFSDVYNVFFLSDFKDTLSDLNISYLPMVDQIVASKGKIFYGTFYSTFTGYITRLRGYYATKNHIAGYKEGITKSFYFFPSNKKRDVIEYKSVKGPFWAREFPAAWRDINLDVKLD